MGYAKREYHEDLCRMADDSAREMGFEDADAYDRHYWQGYEPAAAAPARLTHLVRRKHGHRLTPNLILPF